MIKLCSDQLLSSGFVIMLVGIVRIFKENNSYFLDIRRYNFTLRTVLRTCASPAFNQWGDLSGYTTKALLNRASHRIIVVTPWVLKEFADNNCVFNNLILESFLCPALRVLPWLILPYFQLPLVAFLWSSLLHCILLYFSILSSSLLP